MSNVKLNLPLKLILFTPYRKPIMVIEMKKITDFSNKNLLLVDDDSPFRERLARAMEKKGFLVSQAESVKKGIESCLLYTSPSPRDS